MMDILLANVVVSFATCIQVVVGIGFGMIAGPLLALISLDYVPVPLLLNMSVVAMFMIATGHAHIDWPSMPRLLPAILVGTIAAALLIGHIDKATFGMVFGGVILIAVLVSFLGVEAQRTTPALVAGGLASGLAGTIAGLHGIPLAILYHTSSPALVRATIAFVFVIGCGLSLLALSWQGLMDQNAVMMGVTTLPGMAVGYASALLVQDRIKDHHARVAMLTIAGASGAWLLLQSIG